jgi:hypothetical protein
MLKKHKTVRKMLFEVEADRQKIAVYNAET